MKELKVGDRVYFKYQQYVHAMWYGTAKIIECRDNGYVAECDPNTRLGGDPDVSKTDWWPQHHVQLADIQVYHVAEDVQDTFGFGFIPFVSSSRVSALEAVGFIRGLHFRVGDADISEP